MLKIMFNEFELRPDKGDIPGIIEMVNNKDVRFCIIGNKILGYESTKPSKSNKMVMYSICRNGNFMKINLHNEMSDKERHQLAKVLEAAASLETDNAASGMIGWDGKIYGFSDILPKFAKEVLHL